MSEPQTAQPYGPQTPRVRAFLQRLASQPALVWLAAARRYEVIAATPAGRQADRGLGAAIRSSAREAARDALIGPVLQMAARAAESAALDSSDRNEVERLAEPALAAALALVVADRIGDAQREILTAAFGAAMPDAAMPDAAMPDAAMPDAAMPDAAASASPGPTAAPAADQPHSDDAASPSPSPSPLAPEDDAR